VLLPAARRGASALLLVLALSACGGDTDDGAAPSGVAVAKDEAIAATVPADIRSGGTLVVATSGDTPPMTYFAEDNRTLTGFDVDLARAIADVLGLRVRMQDVGFDTIVPGLQANRFHLAMASIGVTKERQNVVDFVTYYNGGQGFLTKKDSTLSVAALTDLCGQRVAVVSGTTQQLTLEKEQAGCAAAGKRPYDVQVFPDRNAQLLALEANRADIAYASISVVQYTANKSPAKFRVAGTYKRALVGVALPKNSPLTRPVHDAVGRLMADGVYAKILQTWGLTANAVPQPVINGAEA
jgi:polar amino acid transport system substrate-binding protein